MRTNNVGLVTTFLNLFSRVYPLYLKKLGQNDEIYKVWLRKKEYYPY